MTVQSVMPLVTLRYDPFLGVLVSDARRFINPSLPPS
jgi:hypothetical protein